MASVTDDPERFAYLAEGNAKQARKRVAADVLLRDAQGRILLVNPTYKPHWDLPGGMVEANEPPTQAAARELAEELGLQVAIGRVLVLEWVPPRAPWDDLLHFIFDGGVLSEAQLAQLHIADGEISEFAMCSVEEVADKLRSDYVARVQRALAALEAGTTFYCEHTTHPREDSE